MRDDKILLDSIPNIGLVKEEFAQAKYQLAQMEGSPQSNARLERLRNELQETRVELGIING